MSSLNALRVRDLIRAVRKCQNPSEERALINKERNRIAKDIQEDDSTYNVTVNILKLTYIALIGYSARSGELEVMKLLSHRGFSAKRTAYLALCTIAEDDDEILTLVENHIRTDVFSPDMLQCGAALNAMANIANEGMCRDLLDTILQVIPSTNPHIRKKACLCGLRIVRRIPDFAEHFLEKLVPCFAREYAGSLRCALSLVNYCLQTPAGKSFLPVYRQYVLQATNLLHGLVERRVLSDCAVGNLLNPFLQIKLLEFLRIVASNDAETSFLVCDSLAACLLTKGREQNSTFSILYECVRTIVGIESDAKLRCEGIKCMSSLLGTRSDNFRYIALDCLSRFPLQDLQELQSLQHSRLVLECLKSPDPSIELKGIDLVVKLITKMNIKCLIPDLLEFLKVTTGEVRTSTLRHLCRLITENSPTDEWRIEASLRMLQVGKREISMDFVNSFLALVSCQSAAVQLRVTTSLWPALLPFASISSPPSPPLGGSGGGDGSSTASSKVDHAYHRSSYLHTDGFRNDDKEAQLVCAIWCAGEYADALWRAKEGIITPEVMVSAIEGLLQASSMPRVVKRYGLTALMKIAARYPEFATPLVLRSLDPLMKSTDTRVGDWGKEYKEMLVGMWDVGRDCFGPMPPMKWEEEVKDSGDSKSSLSVSIASTPMSGEEEADEEEVMGRGLYKERNSLTGGCTDRSSQNAHGIHHQHQSHHHHEDQPQQPQEQQEKTNQNEKKRTEIQLDDLFGEPLPSTTSSPSGIGTRGWMAESSGGNAGASTAPPVVVSAAPRHEDPMEYLFRDTALLGQRPEAPTFSSFNENEEACSYQLIGGGGDDEGRSGSSGGGGGVGRASDGGGKVWR